MAKAPGGGTDAPTTGSLNRNLETGPCSTIQKELPNGVILTDAVSTPSWTHGGLMKTMKMAGRPLTTQMEGAHGGGTNIQKIGSLSQNLGTGWQPLIQGTINHIGSTRTDATSVPQSNPGSSMNKAMISDKLLQLDLGCLCNRPALVLPLAFLIALSRGDCRPAQSSTRFSAKEQTADLAWPSTWSASST